jgi:putative transposase
MARGKKHTAEQIVSLLRQIEVAVANGKTTPVACRECGITEQTTIVGARSTAGCRWTRRGA